MPRDSLNAKYPGAKKPSRSCKRRPPPKRKRREKYSTISSLNKGSPSSEVHVSRMPKFHPANKITRPEYGTVGINRLTVLTLPGEPAWLSGKALDW